MNTLSGQIVIVTGSDSGMGRAMALAFAREGADVVITYHSDQEGAQSTFDEVKRRGNRALMRQVDVGDETSVVELFKAVSAELGTPTVLVNNAGIGMSKAFIELTAEDFDKTIRTDLRGPFLCSREFVRLREKAGGGGKILNITSVHDSIPSPGNVPYGAAKGGLLTMTRSLALELAPMGINVNAVAPGMIDTPMTHKRLEDPQTRAKELPNIPFKRPGRPEEIAEMALFLIGPDSAYITGQNFVVDGGLEMNWGQGA